MRSGSSEVWFAPQSSMPGLWSGLAVQGWEYEQDLWPNVPAAGPPTHELRTAMNQREHQEQENSGMSQQNLSQYSHNSNLYKTELCRSFSDNGYCRYGSKCQFAHGPNDLRPVVRHRRWKTEKCKNFLNGSCPYGARCDFIHHEDLLYSSPTQVPGLSTTQSMLDPVASSSILCESIHTSRSRSPIKSYPTAIGEVPSYSGECSERGSFSRPLSPQSLPFLPTVSDLADELSSSSKSANCSPKRLPFFRGLVAESKLPIDGVVPVPALIGEDDSESDAEERFQEETNEDENDLVALMSKALNVDAI